MTFIDKRLQKIDELSHWVRWQRLLRGWSAKQLANEAVKSAQKMGHELQLRQQAVSFLESGRIKSIPVWIEYVEQAFKEHPLPQSLSSEVQDSPLKLPRYADQSQKQQDCTGKIRLPDSSRLKKLFLGLMAPVETSIPLEERRNLAEILSQKFARGLEQISLFE
ncbi:MAG: hypothetical protein ABF788_05905 [Zymomonas mobilis]